MKVEYVVAAVIVIVIAALAAYMIANRPAAPSIGVSPEEINALGEYEEINTVQEITTDVLPSADELNIDVNDVTMELPQEI